MHRDKETPDLEKSYRQLYESLPIAYFTLSQRGIILQVNEPAERLLGCKSANILRRNFSAFLPKELNARKTGNMVLSELLQGKSFKDVEMQMRKADGTPLWVSITAGPLSKDRAAPRYGVMALDINRRKLAEQREDEERSRADLYLEVVTHDLNSVNQSILFALGLIESGVKLPDALQSTIQEAQWNVRKSARMISNMKHLIQLRDTPPMREEVDLHPLFTSAVESVKADFPWKTLKVNSNIEEGSFLLYGHKQVEDIIFNILHNSVMFDENTEVHVDVYAELIDNDRVVRLEFTDRGPGIADQLKEFVFKRTGRPELQVVGRGLGLTFVDAIVETLGGEIWVEDRVEGDYTRGCKFICMIPAWVENERLPCGNQSCIFFYKSNQCFWCDPALEILMGILEEVGVASTSVEVINIDDPSVKMQEADFPMLPYMKLCDIELSGFMSEPQVRQAVMKLLMKPCYYNL
ncbi:MAG: PAS domain-containing sensor histidine kinase [Candidatus Thorarchaeota archaeon]|nr:PAS domain-containing sensor histidine kinase [Candidatus Thorarchaeota archaeon]